MNHPFGCSAVLAACMVVTGCSDSGDRPDIGEVTGVVTFDGQPLPNASISFAQPGFRSSVGNTDSKGRYELIYIRDIKGAAVGTHVVKIKQFGKRGKRLPRRYNAESELSRDVEPGYNEFDFDLKSNP
jgi:hypothetical protein